MGSSPKLGLICISTFREFSKRESVSGEGWNGDHEHDHALNPPTNTIHAHDPHPTRAHVPRTTITFLCPLPKEPFFDCMAHRRSGMFWWWWTSGSVAQRKLTRAFHWSVAGNGTARSIMMVLAVILGTG